MARLGLSDSMRSNASLKDTKPLQEAKKFQDSRQAHTEISAETCKKHEVKPKCTSFVVSNPLPIVVGSIVAIMLLYKGAKEPATPLRATKRSMMQVEEQLEQLERRISLLYRDTTRLKTTADHFLQQCQETHLAVSTRNKILQNTAMRSFGEQMKTQMKEHVQVTREVLQYYAAQKQMIKETSERLTRLNISFPMEIAVNLAYNVSQDKQQMIQGKEEGLERDDTLARGLSDAMKGLLLFAEKAQHNESDYERSSIESITIETGIHLERNSRQTTMGQSTLHGLIFFYIFVVCASIIYLWNVNLNTRKKKLLKNKWLRSRVPKVASQLKRLLGSVVVIEDLRAQSDEDVSHKLLERIEPIEC
ncbi:unnamed protein product [Peronospora belbahrii]|uniref:Uncharacterized protein n=1 Tax=Peronospora belbahrii TaxID=622444 RepID=A0ABN8CVU2_9STRA|nr:unnamed protein product [Peronospora belbahrii]